MAAWSAVKSPTKRSPISESVRRLIKPGYISDAIGLVLLALVFVVQKLSVDAKRHSAG